MSGINLKLLENDICNRYNFFIVSTHSKVKNLSEFVNRFKWIFFVLILFNILLSAWFVINKDLDFHTDIARDFLLLEDIVNTRKPTLIGARSGVPGIFHGPSWLYLNLPAFIIGRGNPIAVGWFWVFLTTFSVGFIYWMGKKLFNKEVALFATLIFSGSIIIYTKGLFNPFGAVILFPVLLYLLMRYLQKENVYYLLTAYFLIGLIIQFQVAFGIPILILSTLYLIIKRRKIIHLLFAFIILTIPLSTYIIFEVRHNFLQTHAIIKYLTTKQPVGEVPLPQLISTRIQGIFLDGINITVLNNVLNFPATLVLIAVFYKLIIIKKIKWREVYVLYFFFYLGFWIITFFYKGVVWSYYYWPFLPLTLLIIVSSYSLINKKLFTLVIIYFVVITLYFGIKTVQPINDGWAFYHKLAQTIYTDANQEFGYYIYTPDLFGYSSRYAMNFTQKERTIRANPFQKKKLTYLIIAPAPSDKPFLNGNWWKIHQVKINRKPDNVIKYANGFVVEKYILTDAEQNISSDPNLIQDLTLR